MYHMKASFDISGQWLVGSNSPKLTICEVPLEGVESVTFPFVADITTNRNLDQIPVSTVNYVFEDVDVESNEPDEADNELVDNSFIGRRLIGLESRLATIERRIEQIGNSLMNRNDNSGEVSRMIKESEERIMNQVRVMFRKLQ